MALTDITSPDSFGTLLAERGNTGVLLDITSQSYINLILKLESVAEGDFVYIS